MKMLEQKDYLEIRTWFHRNARPLDLAVWNFYFENGSKEDIIKALSYYQNEDGGFGNAVEPDCWNPESSPYATLTVIGLLRKTGAMEEAGTGHPMIQGIFLFLESGVHSNEDGWFFSIPSSDTCPHAPWWSYDEEANKLQGMGITAGLCAFIFRYGDRESNLFQKAAEYTRTLLKRAADADDFGEMGAGGICMLLGDIMESGLSSLFAFDGLMEKMAGIANAAIERNPEKWALYTPRPSEFIWAPDSPLYKGNEQIVEAELDYLLDTRNPSGVWNITWTWFDLGEKYPKEFAVSENWWMASKAIEKVIFLKNFGRIRS